MKAVARTINPKAILGALPSVFEGGAFDFAFSRSSRTRGNDSPALITIQPSFSTIHCKPFNIPITSCYPFL